jgi:uncharacterized protein involved in type VI secretion and phage assembly
MPATLAFNDFKVKVSGSPLPEAFNRDLLEIVVETDLHQPGMFVIRLHDDELTWMDGDKFALGAEVEIQAADRADASQQGKLLFKGEVTALEPDFDDGHHAIAVIRGYDKSHRLHRGRQTRVFQQMTDSDLASKVAKEAGLSAEADATSEVFPHIVQNNQTNMEFLLERAERLGYRVYAADGKLCFKKPAHVQFSNTPELEWGVNLLSFRPRLSAAHQVNTFKAQGWDPQKKESISNQATQPSQPNQGGISSTGGSAAQKAFGGSAQEVVVTETVASAADAKSVAEGRAALAAAGYVQAEGVCWGTPGVQAGTKVKISKVGSKFSGNYYVTAATHRLAPGEPEGYTTTFYVTGREPNTVSHLLGVDGDRAPSAPEGVVVALVTNTSDPDDFGRVKLKYPWLSAEVESHWARVASPMAGAQRGFQCIPEVNDEVLVAFEHGDINQPYVIGQLWNGKDKPPLAVAKYNDSGKTKQRIWKTRAGHEILLDDTSGSELILIQDKTGKNKITLLSSTNEIKIESDSHITVTSKTGDIKMEGMNINLTAKGNIAVKAQANCNVEAQASLSIKGTATATVEGGASLTLKDSGGGQIAMTGPIVNVNNGALEVM